MVFYLVFAAAAAAVLLLGLTLVRRWYVARRIERRMALRLRKRYPPAALPPGSAALIAPPGPRGFVAVGPDGVTLDIQCGATDPRHVPWLKVNFGGAAKNALAVHICGVGDIHVPGVLGIQLWDELQRSVPVEALPRASQLV